MIYLTIISFCQKKYLDFFSANSACHSHFQAFCQSLSTRMEKFLKDTILNYAENE